ncbi:MAG: PKD domain-containing protein [Schleiferiaceae bacterium]|nr:PKD domain-containing protein [Schleiferiaceae bacterium]MDR9441101.1 PKD domain-containing protein [Schleiferiaceae bacterium]
MKLFSFPLTSRLAGLSILSAGLFFTSCQEDSPELGPPPSSEQASFSYAPTDSSDNIIQFTAADPEAQAVWDFGNGESDEGTVVSAVYPRQGIYTVKLTVFTKGGNASTSQDITIDQDDPSLLDNELYNLLSGGAQGPGSKTWVIDSTSEEHFGVGPEPAQAGLFPEYYAATALEKSGSGMYNDRYVFTFNGFGFDMITNGDIYINTEHKDQFSGAVESPVGDYIAPFPDQLNESWSITEASDTTLTVSGNAFLSYYTGVQTYQIINIEEDELFLRFLDTKAPDLAWYIRLVPE